MEDYEAIVIGAGLGGLSTAAILAKNGMRTLLLEQSDIIGGCCSTYEVDGYKFDVGASIVEVLHPMERFFELMGKRREDYVDLVPCDPIYSFITEDGRRFSYPTDIDETTRVIESIAPEDVEGWKRFSSLGFELIEKMMDAMMLSPMKTIPEALSMVLKNPQALRFLPLMLRTHQGVTRSFYKTPVIQSSVAFQSYFAGAPPEIGSGIFGFIALTEHMGIYYPRGGMIGIPEGMMRAGREHGLELRTGQKVEKILVEGRKARGVRLEDGTEITSDLVVSNVNAKVAYLKMVGPENLPRWAVKAIDSYRHSMPCPMIYVGLDARPDLEAHHTVVTSSIQDMNNVWNNYYTKDLIPSTAMSLVCWPTEADPSLAPEGHHVLNFMCNAPAPYAPLGDNWDRIKNWYREEAVKNLERIVPGVGNHITYMEVSTPLDFERRLLSPQGSIYGLFSDMTSLA
ncbi:MAG: phytoene desaturase family protein, partial [Actinomycetota bacterium]